MDEQNLASLQKAGFTVVSDLKWPYACCSADCCQRHRRRLAWFEAELDFYVSLVKAKNAVTKSLSIASRFDPYTGAPFQTFIQQR